MLRTALATLFLFFVCGYALAQVLVDGEPAGHRALLVLPLGAVAAALSLAVMGLLHVPLKLSLGIVVIAGAAGAVLVRRRGTGRLTEAPGFDATERALVSRIVVPLLLAGTVALISLLPIFRSGFATVPGENGDAILVVGTAVLLEHAPPTATRTDLPIPRIPLEWRSKYPIYYPLAAVSTLAGQDPIQAFATVSAVMLALGALGFFLFARYTLRAPPWAALLALLLVPLDRIVMYVTIHPYYNELWGQFTLPFVLLSGWRFVQAPSRGGGALLALFSVLGLLAYPLMFPFPAVFLLTHAVLVWRRRRAAGESVAWVAALRLPRPHIKPWVWVPAVVVAVPVALVLVRGFLEKVVSALQVLAPWSSLRGWSGTALGYLPWPQFVGLPGPSGLNFAGMAVACLLAVLGLSRLRADVRVPLAAMVAVTVLIGVYFRLRTYGQLFFFKDLAFLGPYVLLLALLGLAGTAASRSRWQAGLGLGGLAAALVIVPLAAAAEIDTTYDNASRTVLELRVWNRELPKGSSVRVDVPQDGWQLWVGYMFTEHRLSALDPLTGIFPHPQRGRKADYVIARAVQARPADAVGAPLLQNRDYRLWRMSPAVPGPDISTRPLIYDTSSISIG
ncbi:MAG: hypothetical protein M3Z27_04065 [Actinomycetota bacterium]|nr:hypothetical protein [Actinomycetota bacterium]